MAVMVTSAEGSELGRKQVRGSAGFILCAWDVGQCENPVNANVGQL